jgi:transcriptional regulator with XRE-family HTH domain
MTQKQLAAALSLSKFSISMYENGKSTPAGDTLIKMAQIFDVTSDYLLGLSDEKLGRGTNSFCFYLPKGIPDNIKDLLNTLGEYLCIKYK